MFGVELEAARQQWIENYDEEDGSSAESLRVALCKGI
jgi:hypothetical protein